MAEQTRAAEERRDYLVHRRHPSARAMSYPPSLSKLGMRTQPENRADILAAAAAYRAELVALSYEKLCARYDEEKRRELQELLDKATRDEQTRFFHQPHANADFDHWSKAAHWTIDEAIALSFGKAPEHVTWDKIKPVVQISAFAAQYARRRDLATRAVAGRQLFDPVLPTIFVDWAERLELGLPDELTAAVRARASHATDWKELFKQSKQANEKSEAQWSRMFSECRASLEKNHKDWRTLSGQKDELIRSLEERVRQVQTQSSDAPAKQKELSTRERDSLLKLTIGMAVLGYGFDPKAERSPQVQEIADDLARAGVSLDADTVRKWLRIAADLLPSQ
jgi:hypothetical protein